MARDEYGRPLYTFLLEYQMGGKIYETEVMAYSDAEALRHIEAVRQSLVYVGKLYSRIEA